MTAKENERIQEAMMTLCDALVQAGRVDFANEIYDGVVAWLNGTDEVRLANERAALEQLGEWLEFRQARVAAKVKRINEKQKNVTPPSQ